MASPIVNGVVTVVLVAIVLIVGVIVFGQFEANITHKDYTGNASEAINKTTQQTYSGFKLGSLIPFILFATLIILVILSAFAFRR